MRRALLIALLLAGCKSRSGKHAPGADAAPAVALPAPGFRALEDGLLPPVVVTGVDLRMKLAERMAHHGTPALGVAVIDHGKLAWAHSWGVLERGQPAVVDDATLFQAASVSKPVVAVAVLRLVEQGKLELDTDVSKYLKTWIPPKSDRPLTVRRLLSHTAGLNAPEQLVYAPKPDGTLPGYAQGAPLPTTLHILRGEPPAENIPVDYLAPPPTGFAYSGGGYTVLQQIIEDVTGQDFPAAMHDLVLAPMGMTRSTFETTPPDGNVAHAHAIFGTPHPGGWRPIPEKAAGGLWTTPGDLGRFLADLLAAYRGEPGHALSPAMAKQMLTPVADARPTMGGSIGLGMFVSDDAGDPWFSHNGHNPGFHATIAAMPTLGLGVVWMMNREDGMAILDEVRRGVGALYQWPPRAHMAPRVKQLATLAPDALAKLAGSYADGDFRVVVRVAGSQLWASVGGAPEARVYPTGPDELIEPYDAVKLTFSADGVSVLSPGGKRDARRLP